VLECPSFPCIEAAAAERERERLQDEGGWREKSPEVASQPAGNADAPSLTQAGYHLTLPHPTLHHTK